jgi:predicted CXXCH cytochrome family protein
MKFLDQLKGSHGSGIMPNFLFIFFLLMLFGLFGRKEAVAGEAINPHDFKQKELCMHCHTSSPPELSSDPIHLCLRCHPDNLADHRVDIVPTKANIPENVSLTKEGKLACFSCHDYHNTMGNEKMLIVPYNELCILCHTGFY